METEDSLSSSSSITSICTLLSVNSSTTVLFSNIVDADLGNGSVKERDGLADNTFEERESEYPLGGKDWGFCGGDEMEDGIRPSILWQLSTSWSEMFGFERLWNMTFILVYLFGFPGT